MDGWGYAPPSASNSISLARTPNYNRLLSEYPNTLIHTSGRYVGLPSGQMGNSEVGHLNIGAGRVVYMDISKIDVMIEDGALAKNAVLLDAFETAKKNGGKLHFIGLLSDGGVHSHQNHLYALLKYAKQAGLDKVYTHPFLDGRDTPPDSGLGYIEQLEKVVAEVGAGQIASVSGRYYAMDRDQKWERERKAFEAMVLGNSEGGKFSSAVEGLKQSYNNKVYDEFVVPFVVAGADGKPLATIADGDVVVNFNFRADRARQITRVLARESGITANGGRDLPTSETLDTVIPRNELPQKLHYVCLTDYDANFQLPVISPAEHHTNILADVMSQNNLRNLRTAETEKYAHVTFFFNGGVEKAFPGEERLLVPSPKVATYDLKPEMSAPEVCAGVVKSIEGGSFDVIVVNFANTDMVGHSGKIPPTIKAVETVDTCLGEVYKALRAKNGAMLLTADHGNAEQMIDPVTGGPFTAHTTNPVPLVYVAEDAAKYTLAGEGSLRDLSPTMLGILGIEQPKEMTGRDLRSKID
jgi:2,3-bisphosphoglycerate-independent phosphoglycerate mutase